MSELVLPLESAEFVIKNAKSVEICQEGVVKLSKKIYESLNDKSCSYFNWKAAPLNPKKANEFAINWIFFVDTMNFSFWSDAELIQLPDPIPIDFKMPQFEKYTVIYNQVPYHGYWALCAAVNRALDEGIPITEPHFYAHLNEQELRHIFRSDSNVQIPLLELRLRILQESGRILNEEFQGSFLNCIKRANGSALQLLNLIVAFFPSYRDEAIFLDRKVTFYKRAQILVADIWGCFEGKSYGNFSDIDKITMFADYRVPQVLKFYDAIKYGDDLNSFLRRNVLMNSGARYEIEIRAASILACHLISNEVKKLLDADKLTDSQQIENPFINDILVDFYLWNFRVDNAALIDSNSLPFHKVRSHFY